MRKLALLLRAALIGIFIGSLLLAVVVAEGALHMPGRATPHPKAAGMLARVTNSTWEPARIVAADGIPLEAWLFRPPDAGGSAVILLHGVGDSRLGMMGHAQFLLDAGFIVLAPDVRGHGSSGGDITTYGIREAGDIHAWADWLFREHGIQRLYGMGESMGAAILLQSLPREPRFRAVVAECPFATLEEVANYRLEHASHLGIPFTWPLVRTAFLYGRLRYGIDLRQASPAAAIRSVHTPILLIHGSRDVNIPPEHSRELHAANPAATQLWEVAGAEHVAAISVQPSRFVRRVTDWFWLH